MPWLIQHKCHPSDPEVVPYAIYRGHRDGLDFTKVSCPKRNCREEFFIIGHEMFTQAERTSTDSNYPNLPPGFVIASKRSS